MTAVLILLIVLVTPAVLWFRGGRLLGNQTHPAAVFILAWMLSALLLGSLEWIPSAGVPAFLWVAVNFAVFAAVAGIRKRPSTGSNPEQPD